MSEDSEVDVIGAFAVAWPRLRCAICARPAPQRHGQPMLEAEGERLCFACWMAARHLPLAAVRRIRAAR